MASSSFLNPTSQRVRTVPVWYGPVLPRVTNRGAPLTLVDPFATSDPQKPGAIFSAAASLQVSIISALNMLFGTRPGERIYLPKYGLNMEALVFDPLDDTMIVDAQTAIKTAVESYIPSVLIVRVQVNKDANTNQVSFVLTMQVRGSTPNDLLTYSTPSTPSV